MELSGFDYANSFAFTTLTDLINFDFVFVKSQAILLVTPPLTIKKVINFRKYCSKSSFSNHDFSR